MYFSRYIALMLLFLTFIPFATAEEINIHGSTTVNSVIFKKHKQAIEKSSSVKINILANSSSMGILDLLDGKAHIAMISAPIESVSRKINKIAQGRVDTSELTVHKVGVTSINFITHASNTVSKLSRKQIRKILRGEISNWKQVGGPDSLITVVSEKFTGGIRIQVERAILNNKKLAPFAHTQVRLSSSIPAVTAGIPGALGIYTAGKTAPGTRVVETGHPIEQPLFLVTRGELSQKVKDVIASSTSLLH